MFRNVVMIGTCQVAVLADMISHRAALSFGTKIRVVDATVPLSPAGKAVLEQADAVIEQVFNVPQRANIIGLDLKGKIIRFPSISGHFMWPYAGRSHPGQDRACPADIFAGLELGDSKLGEIFSSDKDREAQVESYISSDLAKPAVLARRYEVFLKLQHERDVAAGFSVTSIIEDRFRHERLFRTPGHPSMRLFQPLIRYILTELDFPDSFVSAGVNGPVDVNFSRCELPIHPSIAAYFQLEHGHQTDTYHVGTGEQMTFAEHARHYVFLTHNQKLAETVNQFRLYHKIPDEQIKDAVDTLEAACADSRGSIMASEILSRLYIKLDDKEKAMHWAQEGVRLRPNSPATWLNYGRVSVKLGMLAEAEEGIRATLAMRPLSAILWNELSMIYQLRGQHDQALELVTKAESLDEWDMEIKRRAKRMRNETATAVAAQ